MIIARSPVSRIIRVPELAVFHRRDTSTNVLKQSATQTLLADISGFASYRALSVILGTKSRNASGLSFSDDEVQAFCERFEHFYSERLAFAEMSIARIHGLVASIENLDPDLKALMTDIDIAFGISSAWELISSGTEFFESPSRATLTSWLHGLSAMLPESDLKFDSACNDFTGLVRTKLCARELCARGFEANDLVPVGIGCEGVTFRCNSLALKVMDLLGMRAEPEKHRYMQRLLDDERVKSSFSVSLLFPHSEAAHQNLILQRPFISGQAYSGGFGKALVALLLSLCRAGISCTNISPANVIVKLDSETGDATLHLVDFGLDITTHSEPGNRSNLIILQLLYFCMIFMISIFIIIPRMSALLRQDFGTWLPAHTYVGDGLRARNWQIISHSARFCQRRGNCPMAIWMLKMLFLS